MAMSIQSILLSKGTDVITIRATDTIKRAADRMRDAPLPRWS